ncbi:hypothetical protein C8R45DRAFT_805596, partial [Mycena sanguinolenta]
PRLPPELECCIFEIAALSCPLSIPSLVLIARRVKDWVEPLLYRVILVPGTVTPGRLRMAEEVHRFPSVPYKILARTIARKPPSFFQSVTHVFVDGFRAHGELNLILAACTHIVNLAYFGIPSPSDRKSLDRLQCLRRLTIMAEPLFSPHGLDFTAALFHNITHLELLDDCHGLPDGIGPRLALAPALTHIS